ncbi:uncharacterized protein LOC18427651 isoform X2 [Amborella trichopoda]|uniref:Viral late gene transcription factor 3 zinc ribbon domain-containing protein n=1 Tax=Amborella trichopoda TaxID=13333 RepID=W1NRK2_AMBTC|nr:uncharacterized protein LOC18427651 isoform X2 [Amborella trichopoda]ERM99616.1 hypothetical protein AMTR_s00088p00160310 [Amborella trichopoda]|eukprot:XP_006836763.1 uncharacterized protein LOC18427651 isoform X2 [Amborella trichopoda]
MDCVLSSSPVLVSTQGLRNSHLQWRKSLTCSSFLTLRRNGSAFLSNNGRNSTYVKALAAEFDPVRSEITWQILTGTLAGVIPFVVAGIEFSKRIIAQKRCDVCGGSGLVLRDKDYSRCPGCGGFFPWQSWKRFFSG